jgi:hypothetical protein
MGSQQRSPETLELGETLADHITGHITSSMTREMQPLKSDEAWLGYVAMAPTRYRLEGDGPGRWLVVFHVVDSVVWRRSSEIGADVPEVPAPGRCEARARQTLPPLATSYPSSPLHLGIEMCESHDC